MMIEPWGEDAPWWYNERASLSQFAGALWREGGWVFEEYCVNKSLEQETYRGRVDMMFEYSGYRAVAEAKQIWPSLDSRHGWLPQVDEVRRVVEREAACAPLVDNTYQRLGIVFLAPIVSPRFAHRDEQYERVLTAFIEEVKLTAQASVAWAFPGDRRHLHSKAKNYYFPGVILVVGTGAR